MCDSSQAEMLLADGKEAFGTNLKFPADIQTFKKELLGVNPVPEVDCCEWLL